MTEPAGDLLEPQPLVFHGEGREYFRIWIVNLALSVITVGIYSAWAKVRRLQYFYRNTRLAGASFDYHGSPIALLKGRLVAAVMLAAYYGAAAMSPLFGLAAFGVLALALPWLIVRSLRFRCYNSSYRGIRFRFHGTTAQAYWVYLGLPLLSVLTLFLLFPLAHQRMRQYQQNNLAYGSARFTARLPVGEFYITHILGAVAFGVLMVAAVIAMVAMAVALAAAGAGAEEPPAILMVVFFVLYGTGLLLSRAIVLARIQNFVWSHTRMGPHGFFCSLAVQRIFGITLTNVLATIATLGLFLPFAQVRLMRYLASELRFYPGGSLDDIVNASSDDAAAVGEEAAELFDFDIAF